MRFDWYQTTIDAPADDVLEQVMKLGDRVKDADKLASRYRYDKGWEISRDDCGTVAHVFAGGNGGKPHAFASGQATDAFVDLVRSEWPDRHLVTRMDAAEDFNEEGCYDRIRLPMKRIAKRFGLNFPQYEDDLNPSAGRTQYVGSPKSDYRARLYEKGWEEVNKQLARFNLPPGVSETIMMITNTVTGEMIRPQDWTRLELQVRPRQEEGRRMAAFATPEEAWSFSPGRLN